MVPELRVVKDVAPLFDVDVEHAHPLPVPRKRPVLRARREADLLAGFAGTWNVEHPEPVGAPRDRGRFGCMLEHGRLATEEIDEHVPRDSNRRETRDVACARGSDEA